MSDWPGRLDVHPYGIPVANPHERDNPNEQHEEQTLTDTCRSCHAEIEWAITSKGRRIPLDLGSAPNANITVIGRFINGTPAVDMVEVGQGDRVSHFATCPDANDHRKSRR